MCVRSVHGVAWSGSSRTRNGVAARAERAEHRSDDVGVPPFERVDLHVGESLMTRFVGRLDVHEEEVAVLERRTHASACAR